MASAGKARGGRFVAAAAAATFLLSGPVAGQALRPHPIDLGGPYREADYRPIAAAIGTAPVVALGESIHISREMPLVRLRLLRALHGTRGVDALVLEGSLLNAWTAQEHAYRSKAPLGERARLVPQMMRARLQHCREAKAPGAAWNVYQRVRDEMNAKLVVSLMRAMPRLVLWAHHSHLHHNSLGGSTPSMGQHLKALLGDRLYTVGVFARGGAAVDSLELDSAGGAGIVAALAGRPLPGGARFGVERRLSGLSDQDFFVDLRGAPPQWAQPDFSRLEVGARMPTALARDFDGAILLHEVSGAELNFLPAPLRGAVRAVGWVLRSPVLAALGALLVLLALGAGIRGLWRRRRARRARRGTAAA